LKLNILLERFEEQKKEIKELKSFKKIDKETLKDMTYRSSYGPKRL